MIWNSAIGLAVALTVIGGAGINAQQADTATSASPDQGPLWLISCSNQADPAQLLCESSQSLIVAQGSQRLATASFQRVAGQDRTQAVLTVPFGVSLAQGVTIAVDDATVGTLTYDSCDGQGCYATGDVDAEWLQRMRDGTAMSASVTDREGRQISLSFQLTGFTASEALMP